MANGQHSPCDAETDIALVIRDQKIECRSCGKITITTFDGRIVHPQSPAIMNLKRQGLWRVSPPRDLAPGELDFATSAPRRPWVAPGFYVHIPRLELSKEGLKREFHLEEAPKETRATTAPPSAADREDIARPSGEAIGEGESNPELNATLPPAEVKGEAREEASPPKASERQTVRIWTRRALAETYPAGIPSQAEVPNKILIDNVTKLAKKKGWTIGKRDTILREAGRRPRK